MHRPLLGNKGEYQTKVPFLSAHVALLVTPLITGPVRRFKNTAPQNIPGNALLKP